MVYAHTQSFQEQNRSRRVIFSVPYTCHISYTMWDHIDVGSHEMHGSALSV